MKIILLIPLFSMLAIAQRITWLGIPQSGNDLSWSQGSAIAPVICWVGKRGARQDIQGWSLYLTSTLQSKQLTVSFVPAAEFINEINSQGSSLNDIFGTSITDTSVLTSTDANGNPSCYVAKAVLPLKSKGRGYSLKLKRKWGWKIIPGHRNYNSSPKFSILKSSQAAEVASQATWWDKVQLKCSEAYGNCKTTAFQASGNIVQQCQQFKELCSTKGQQCGLFWNNCMNDIKTRFDNAKNGVATGSPSQAQGSIVDVLNAKVMDYQNSVDRLNQATQKIQQLLEQQEALQQNVHRSQVAPVVFGVPAVDGLPVQQQNGGSYPPLTPRNSLNTARSGDLFEEYPLKRTPANP